MACLLCFGMTSLIAQLYDNLSTRTMSLSRLFGFVFLAGLGLAAQPIYPDNAALSTCPGYKVSNVKTTSQGVTADLALAGKACNVYGTDIDKLRLVATYETGKYISDVDALELY